MTKAPLLKWVPNPGCVLWNCNVPVPWLQCYMPAPLGPLNCATWGIWSVWAFGALDDLIKALKNSAVHWKEETLGKNSEGRGEDLSADCFFNFCKLPKNMRLKANLAESASFERKICFEGGLAAMELLAMTMRAEGMLSCRSLSFKGLGGWPG